MCLGLWKSKCCTYVSIQTFKKSDVLKLKYELLQCIQGFDKCRLKESSREQQNGVMTTNGIQKS